MMDALDSFEQRAVSLITSGKVASALDTSKNRPNCSTATASRRIAMLIASSSPAS